MKSITKRLFLYAFIFALAAAGAIFVYLRSLEPEDIVTIEKTDILVAAQNIPARTKISIEMLKSIEIPKEGDYGVFMNDSSDLVGQYTKEAIYQNERFLSEKLLEALEDELSLMIEPDHRAISVMVNLDSGVANLIRPGDSVDILVFLPELKEADRIVRPTLAKMVLQSVKVLAIDQDLFRDAEPKLEIPPTFYVTLSIPVLKVERLVLAQNIGSIKLALRPLEENFVYDTDGVIWEELLLDETNKMKDLLPQFEIKSDSENISTGEEPDLYDKYYYYTIKYGDTLVSISRKFYNDETKFALIKEVNKIGDDNTIVTGTGLKIPVLSEEGENDAAD